MFVREGMESQPFFDFVLKIFMLGRRALKEYRRSVDDRRDGVAAPDEAAWGKGEATRGRGSSGGVSGGVETLSTGGKSGRNGPGGEDVETMVDDPSETRDAQRLRGFDVEEVLAVEDLVFVGRGRDE